MSNSQYSVLFKMLLSLDKKMKQFLKKKKKKANGLVVIEQEKYVESQRGERELPYLAKPCEDIEIV